MDKDISKKQEDINDFLTEKCKIENNDNDKISEVDNDLEEECDINDINTLNSEYTSDILNLNSSNNITTNIENEIKIKLKKSCVLYREREIKILDNVHHINGFNVNINEMKKSGVELEKNLSEMKNNYEKIPDKIKKLENTNPQSQFDKISKNNELEKLNKQSRLFKNDLSDITEKITNNKNLIEIEEKKCNKFTLNKNKLKEKNAELFENMINIIKMNNEVNSEINNTINFDKQNNENIIQSIDDNINFYTFENYKENAQQLDEENTTFQDIMYKITNISSEYTNKINIIKKNAKINNVLPEIYYISIFNIIVSFGYIFNTAYTINTLLCFYLFLLSINNIITKNTNINIIPELKKIINVYLSDKNLKLKIENNMKNLANFFQEIYKFINNINKNTFSLLLFAMILRNLNLIEMYLYKYVHILLNLIFLATLLSRLLNKREISEKNKID